MVMTVKRLKRRDEPAGPQSPSYTSPNANGYRCEAWIRHQPLARQLCPHCLPPLLAEGSSTGTTPRTASMTRDSRKYVDQAALVATIHTVVAAADIDFGEENSYHIHANVHLRTAHLDV